MAANTKALLIKDFVLSNSSLIEASAGTGKTFTITYLVLRLLLGSGDAKTRLRQGPLDLDQILIVTFTRAAASDLRKRIRENIRQAREAFDEFAKDPKYRAKDEPLNDLLIEMQEKGISPKDCSQILNKAERGIDTAAICTIHSFCNRALNQIYAFEAGEAFETELTDDVSSQMNEALVSLWRELFYTKEDRGFILDALKNIDPISLMSGFYALQKVKLTDPKDGFHGFALKGLKYLKQNLSLLDNFNCLKAELKQTEEKEQQLLNDFLSSYDKEYLVACYDAKNSCINSSLDIKKAPALLKSAKTLLDDLAASYEDPDRRRQLLDDLSCYQYDYFVNSRSHKNIESCKFLTDFESAVIALRDKVKAKRTSRTLLVTELKLVILMLADEKFGKLCAKARVMSNDDVLKRLDYALNCKGEQSRRLASLLRHRYPVAMIDEFQDTDPTQFAIFKKIYLDKDFADKAFCYLIGDPKQSIYAFRGSDINSYLAARNLVDKLSKGTGLYTLNTNYRSHPNLVDGVNALFSQEINEKNESPFLTGEINFTPVNHNKSSSFFSFEENFSEDKTPADYAAIYVDKILSDASIENKDDAQTLYAKACALRIKECLQHGFIYKKTEQGITKRRIIPSDIAVLVRTQNENAFVQKELAALGIGSVYFSDQSSVLGSDEGISPEASALIFLMEAMCDFSNSRKVRRLLGSDLLSLNGDDFCNKLLNESFEAEVRLLFTCRQRWQREGFLSAFLTWFKDPLHDGLKNTLSLENGERSLTNYFHLAEIMQQSHGRISGIRAQLRWFKDLCSTGRDILNGEDVQKRLDSEYDQVKILTIHKSKGLEFPLVFMPFLWLGGKSKSAVESSIGGVSYYDKKDKRTCFDFMCSDENVKAHNDDAKQEDRRLLYVALTRACYANFLFVADLNLKNAKELTSLRSMLSDDGSPDLFIDKIENADEQRLFCLTQRQKSFYDNAEKYINTDDKNHQGNFTVSVLPQDAICRDFSFSSYSALVAGLHDKPPSVIEGNNEDEIAEIEEEFNQKQLNAFTFPRGAVPGVFLHSLLENCDFTLCSDNNYLKDYVFKFVHQSANQGTVKNWTYDENAAANALTLWLYEIVHAPLLKKGNKYFSLSMLNKGSYIPEMAYLLPSDDMDTQLLNDLCKESAQEIAAKDAFINKLISGLYLDKKVVNGFINGFLDLVMRTDFDGQEKYYVIDYKSTHLGNFYRDYAEKKVTQSVFDERNRYDVQYLLYTLALHRMLKKRKRDYSYEKDIGGVLYLYLRGLKTSGLMLEPEVSSGVFFTKPSFRIIKRLDAIFSGQKE